METKTQPQLAQELVKRLGKDTRQVNLTSDGALWFIHVTGYHPTPNAKTFQRQWELHPEDFHTIKLAGKEVQQSRFSQSWGYSYSYSGSVAPARDFLKHPDGDGV